MEQDRTQYVQLLTGAAITAGFAFLFLTKRGKNLLDSAEPWLEEVIRDMQRLRTTTAKLRDAVDEGRRSFDAVAKLGSFSPSQNTGWTTDARH